MRPNLVPGVRFELTKSPPSEGGAFANLTIRACPERDPPLTVFVLSEATPANWSIGAWCAGRDSNPHQQRPRRCASAKLGYLRTNFIVKEPLEAGVRIELTHFRICNPTPSRLGYPASGADGRTRTGTRKGLSFAGMPIPITSAQRKSPPFLEGFK